jgi:hypothetical protein
MFDHTFRPLISPVSALSGLLLRMVMAFSMGLYCALGGVQAQDLPQTLFDSKAPQFNWVLSDNPIGMCAQARKDGTHTVADACSYWVQQERRCTLVTKPDKASHQVLGVLFSACQRGLRA